MTYCHLRADCLYTGISSGPNTRYRVWEAFTFLPADKWVRFLWDILPATLRARNTNSKHWLHPSFVFMLPSSTTGLPCRRKRRWSCNADTWGIHRPVVTSFLTAFYGRWPVGVRIIGILNPIYTIQPVVKMVNRLYIRFDNRLYHVNKHPTGCQTSCQTGFTTGLTTGCIV